MPVEHEDLFAALAAPIPRHLVKQRPQGGRQLDYITARTVMNKLDDVLGPSNWWDDYHQSEHSVICRLTIRLPDGSTITKVDAGGYAGMSDQGDDDKSGFSDAFKRAAVKFGVGRELYKDGVASFVGGGDPLARRASAPPPRPNGHPAPPPRPAPAPPRQQQQQHSDNGSAPRSGRALFAWTKKQEEEHQVSLLNWLNGYIKECHGGKRMVDLDDREVDDVYTEATRRLKELHSGTTIEEQTQEATPDGDIPFDRAAAWAHLLNVAEDLAGHLFSDYRGTDAEMQSALASLDPLIPDHLRVRDWDQCHDRDSFKAYYREAVDSVREYQTGQVPT
jgi:hypothetical protein